MHDSEGAIRFLAVKNRIVDRNISVAPAPLDSCSGASTAAAARAAPAPASASLTRWFLGY